MSLASEGVPLLSGCSGNTWTLRCITQQLIDDCDDPFAKSVSSPGKDGGCVVGSA